MRKADLDRTGVAHRAAVPARSHPAAPADIAAVVHLADIAAAVHLADIAAALVDTAADTLADNADPAFPADIDPARLADTHPAFDPAGDFCRGALGGTDSADRSSAFP